MIEYEKIEKVEFLLGKMHLLKKSLKISENEKTKNIVEKIEKCLKEFDTESKAIAELAFNKKLSVDEICQDLHLSRTTYFRRKKQFLDDFTILYFGEI